MYFSAVEEEEITNIVKKYKKKWSTDHRDIDAKLIKPVISEKSKNCNYIFIKIVMLLSQTGDKHKLKTNFSYKAI